MDGQDDRPHLKINFSLSRRAIVFLYASHLVVYIYLLEREREMSRFKKVESI